MPGSDRIGSTLRFLASGGMADEDPEVVAELLRRACSLATAVLADPGSSQEVRTQAAQLIDVLRSDAYGDYGQRSQEAQRSLPL